MIKLEGKIEIITDRIRKIENINLIKVIDFGVFQDLTNGEYIQIEGRIGSKFYRDIGLKSYNYIKILNEIDNQVANKLIIEKMRNTSYNLYIEDNKLLVITERFYKEIRKLEDNLKEINNIEIYELKKNGRVNYIIIENLSGYYIEVDLVEEKIEIYLLSIINGEYFLIDKYSEGYERIETGRNMINLERFYDSLDFRVYSYCELERLKRELKIENLPLEDLERLNEINEYRKRIEFSEYRVKDLFIWIYNNIEKLEVGISRYYKEVEEKRLAYDLMKE